MAEGFKATKSVGQFIYFDDNSRTFMLADSNRVYSYDDISGYDYIEDHGAMGKGGVGRSFSVGMGLFPGKSDSFVATAMKIKLSLTDGSEQFINMLITPAKSNNMIYRGLKKQADDIIGKLEQIHPENAEKHDKPFDYTEELRRLKRLADDGVITEAEFDAKKKKILGI